MGSVNLLAGLEQFDGVLGHDRAQEMAEQGSVRDDGSEHEFVCPDVLQRAQTCLLQRDGQSVGVCMYQDVQYLVESRHCENGG